MKERWISRPALCRGPVFLDDDGLSFSPFSKAVTVKGKSGKSNKNLKRKKTMKDIQILKEYINYESIHDI